MQEKKRVYAKITGRVQGVCFRMETKRTAIAHKVCGWVRNMPDGSVEAVFEGVKVDVDAVIAWCGHGPDFSRVKNVVIEDGPYSGDYSSFDIVY